MADTIKVPYGVDPSGNLTASTDADKGREYRCPGCNSPLILKEGEIRTKHFSHKSDSICNFETVLHITAKGLVSQAIKSNSAGTTNISVRNHCSGCGQDLFQELKPGLFSGASEEYRVGDYVCDVVGFIGAQPRLAIEIRNTHAVNEVKARELPIHWIELDAAEVVDKPDLWKTIQSRLKDAFCTGCKKQADSIHSVADKWAIDRSLYTPHKNPLLSNYVADIERCFSCKETIPVFWWKGVPFCQKEPSAPKPKTIQYRNSKRHQGSYWANTCPNCRVIQGDNFIFLSERSPFKTLMKSEQESMRVVTGDSAVSEFMNILKRNL